MSSVQSLRNFATDLYKGIEARAHIGAHSAQQPDTAQECRDAFEMLRLDQCSDPVAQKLSAAVTQMDTQWVQNDRSKCEKLYGTALRLAAAGLGGPVGCALSQSTDRFTTYALEGLVAESGAHSKDLVDLMVPEKWATQGSESAEWMLASSRSLLAEGKGDYIQHLPWVRHLEGQPVSAQKMDQEFKKFHDFKQLNENRGWKWVHGSMPMELHGREVSILMPIDGKLERLEGIVEAPKRGAAFRLQGREGELNSNSILNQYAAPPPNWNLV